MINELIKYDSNFNEGSFKSYIANVFVKLFTAVMLDELDTVKHFLSDDVYSQYKSKIDDLNSRGVRQMYDELNVKDSNIIDVAITGDEFVVTVILTSRYMDYIVDKNNGDFISGNNQSRIEKNYKLVFTKKRTFLQQGVVRKCPGCGASISVNTSGKCEYCGTIYNLDKYDYILTSIVN